MNVLHPDEIDFSQYLHETDSQQNVKPAGVWVDELIHRLSNPDTTKRALMPWPKTHYLFQFRPGEVTLWQGQNGGGKSLITGQVALGLVGQGEKSCIASFEMKPATTLERMVRQYAQCNPRAPEYCTDEGVKVLEQVYRDFQMFLDGRLWLYDQQGTVEANQVIAMARYCAKELDITHVFIDSLMKCVRGEDDYNGQKAFVDELCSLARDNQIHVHLIHHLRKPANEDAKPGKYDGKGSGAISDQVDNVISIWRNKPKEMAVKEGKGGKEAEPDCVLYVQKQRNGEEEPNIGLFLDRDSMQFVANKGDEPIDFCKLWGWT